MPTGKCTVKGISFYTHYCVSPHRYRITYIYLATSMPAYLSFGLLVTPSCWAHPSLYLRGVNWYSISLVLWECKVWLCLAYIFALHFSQAFEELHLTHSHFFFASPSACIAGCLIGVACESALLLLLGFIGSCYWVSLWSYQMTALFGVGKFHRHLHTVQVVCTL